MSLQFRTMHKGEEDAVFELVRLNDKYHNENNLMPFLAPLAKEWKPGDLVLVCADCDNIVGVLEASSRYGNHFYITNLYVQEEYRGHHIGETLMKMCADASPYPTIALGCSVRNEAAMALYKKLGFKPYTERLYLTKE